MVIEHFLREQPYQTNYYSMHFLYISEKYIWRKSSTFSSYFQNCLFLYIKKNSPVISWILDTWCICLSCVSGAHTHLRFLGIVGSCSVVWQSAGVFWLLNLNDITSVITSFSRLSSHCIINHASTEILDPAGRSDNVSSASLSSLPWWISMRCLARWAMLIPWALLLKDSDMFLFCLLWHVLKMVCTRH